MKNLKNRRSGDKTATKVARATQRLAELMALDEARQLATAIATRELSDPLYQQWLKGWSNEYLEIHTKVIDAVLAELQGD